MVLLRGGGQFLMSEVPLPDGPTPGLESLRPLPSAQSTHSLVMARVWQHGEFAPIDSEIKNLFRNLKSLWVSACFGLPIV